ncbi:MAG: hypothetical protein ABFC34_14450 [Methanobacterium sp.]
MEEPEAFKLLKTAGDSHKQTIKIMKASLNEHHGSQGVDWPRYSLRAENLAKCFTSRGISRKSLLR